MTDFAINIRLKAEGASLASGVKAARTQVDGLARSARDAAGASRVLAGASRNAAQNIQQQARAAGLARAAQSALNAASRSGATNANALAGALRGIGRASQGNLGGLRSLTGALRGVAGDGRRVGAAMQSVASASRTAGSETGRAGKVAAAAKDLFGLLGRQAGSAAAGMLGLSSGSVEVIGSLGRLAVAGGPVGIAIGVVVAAIGGAILVGNRFTENLKIVDQALARAGVSHQVTAEQIRASSSTIATETGQAFEEVEKAQLGLIESGEIATDTVGKVTEMGAKMAATLGGDVVTNTNDVAAAFTSLGNGDATLLADKFRFLDADTRQIIATLAQSGRTAEAQEEFMKALGSTVHGGKGSLGTAFSNLGGAVLDWLGNLVSASGPMKWFGDQVRWLSGVVNGFADAIRQSLGQMPRDAILKGGPPPAMPEGGRGRPTAGAGGRHPAPVTSAPQRAPRAPAPAAAAYRGGGRVMSSAEEEVRTAERLSTELTRQVVSLQRAAEYQRLREQGLDVQAERLEAANELQDQYADLMRGTEAEAAARLKISVDQVRTLREQVRQVERLQVAEFDAKQVKEDDARRQRTEADDAAAKAEASAKAAEAAEKQRTKNIANAEAIGDIIGGKVGEATAQLLTTLEQVSNWDFSGIDSPIGGVLRLIQNNSANPQEDPVLKGFKQFGDELNASLKDLFNDIFGADGPFGQLLTESFGRILAGAEFGGKIGNGVTKALGLKSSKTGGQIGGAIGSLIPQLGPFGPIIGGVIGSLVGGLFKKSKTGSAAVVSQDGSYAAGSAVGNSVEFRNQASGLASTVSSGLQNIAEQLGGIVTGAISVSLGVRNGKPVVDTTGKNRTKGSGVVKFGKGEESAAIAFAIADALKDGAIAGLSEKVKSALTSSTDIERALREALKVDEVEQILAGFGGAAKKSFVDFERQAKERLRIAGKYGFDLVKLEAENAKQRKALLDQSIESVTGGLKNLLQDLISGEKAPGTLLDRRDELLKRKAELEPLAATDASEAQKLTEVLDQLYQVSLEAFGTAGAQFAGDRAGIKSTAEAIIAQATADLTAAQDTARRNAGTDQASTDALLGVANGQLTGINNGMDEANAQLARLIAGVGSLNTILAGFGGGGVNYAALAQLGRIY